MSRSYTQEEIRIFLKAANSDVGNPKFKPKDLVVDYCKCILIGQQLVAENQRLKELYDNLLALPQKESSDE